MATKIGDIKFLGAVDEAAKGSATRLVAFLRSDYPLSQYCRNSLADYIEGKMKKSKGRPKRRIGAPANLPMLYAACDVDRYKRVWRLRYGRTRGIHEEAIEKSAERNSLDPNALANYLNRSKRDRRRRMY